MKRKPGEKLDHLRHRVFQARSANIFRHQKELAAKAGRTLDYDLGGLRGIIAESVGMICAYAGEMITERNFSLDHDVPISRGGSFGLENLRVVSMRGNETKGKLTRPEYVALLCSLDMMGAEAKQDVLRRMRAGGKMLRAYGFGKRGEGKESRVRDGRNLKL